MHNRLALLLRTNRMIGLEGYTRNGVYYCLKGKRVTAESREFLDFDLPTTLKILDGTHELLNYAFVYSNIESVEIPATVKSIGTAAFEFSSLEEVTLFEGLREIKSSAFANTDIQTISIPRSVRCIGDDAFAYCHRLTEVILTEGLLKIGNGAFKDAGLKSVIIPSTVQTIGDCAFDESVRVIRK